MEHYSYMLASIDQQKRSVSKPNKVLITHTHTCLCATLERCWEKQV